MRTLPEYDSLRIGRKIRRPFIPTRAESLDRVEANPLTTEAET